MNLKLWPGLIVGGLVFGLGFLCGWAIWGRTPPPKIPKDATVRSTAPLVPLPPPDTGEQSPARPEVEPDGLAIDTLTEELLFEKGKVTALQRLSAFYRDSIGGLLEKLKLPYRFTAVKDTNLLHTKDSVVVDLMTGRAEFFHSGLFEPAPTLQNQKFGGWRLPESMFDLDLTVWSRGPADASLSVQNPFRPAWWVPGKVGVAARTDGAKGVRLGWPIP